MNLGPNLGGCGGKERKGKERKLNSTSGIQQVLSKPFKSDDSPVERFSERCARGVAQEPVMEAPDLPSRSQDSLPKVMPLAQTVQEE